MARRVRPRLGHYRGRRQPPRPPSRPRRLWGQVRKKPYQFGFVLTLLALCVGALIATQFPGKVEFETRLVVNQLSFVSRDSQRRFLNDVPFSELIITGKQTRPITLPGQFLDPPFQDRDQITIELPNPDSQLILRPIPTSDGPPPSLTLRELQLQTQTDVRVLSYQTNSRRLYLEFDQTNIPDGVEPSQLTLDLGSQAVAITVAGYRIPDLNLEDASGTAPQQIRFIPLSSEWNRPLPLAGSASMIVVNTVTNDSKDWFWGDLAVDSVRFIAERTGRRIEDDVVDSSVQQGTVRMLDQEIKLETDQFLIVENPGIQRLRNLQVLPESGIEIRAVGRTSQVEAGLDPEFPIRSIQASFWNELLPPKTVVAVLSFAGALFASLLSWLIENLFKTD